MRKLIAAALLAATSVGCFALAPVAGAAAGAAGDTSAGASARSSGTCGGDGSSRNPEVVGLTDRRLVCFRASRPGRPEAMGRITGLDTDTRLVGIDYRPATGDLYGLGDQGGVYIVDDSTAQARLGARITVALRGTQFGVDFNPAADRLRVVSDAGQNLRINVADGTTNVDTDLAYTPGTPTAGIVGAMYTNNDTDPNTGTTLFDVDSVLDQVAIQSPPNNGTLVLTGKLGVDAPPELGADIFSKVRNGTTEANSAYLAVAGAGRSTFHAVNPLTGRAYGLGQFPSSDRVVSIAVPLVQG